MSAEVALSVADLHISFGGVKAVDGCSFEVPAGTAVGLIGPNGAGKSTAIDLISGFQPPDAGQVHFHGTPLVGKSPHAISQLGLVRTFQSPREWGSLTVMDNVMLGLKAFERERIHLALFGLGKMRREEDRDRVRVRELLDSFNLTAVKNLPASRLSGGQKRLVEFARIAAAAPRFVILDEPMGGVNPVLGDRIGAAIKELVANGSTVMIVEHNLAFIDSVCDSVVVMAQGRVIAQGPYSSLRDNPEVVTAYLGEMDDA
jgi:branched-chain amino acid transport system ATP-binding protein